jgi:hypothetical protein
LAPLGVLRVVKMDRSVEECVSTGLLQRNKALRAIPWV